VTALLRLYDRLRRLEEDGLDPRHYGIPETGLAAADPAAWQGGLQRAATLALTDLLLGRVRDLPGRPDIRRDATGINLDRWVAELNTTPDPAAVIERAANLPEGASALKAELARQRAVARRGQQPIPGDATIEPGSTDAVRVPALRARLALEDRRWRRRGMAAPSTTRCWKRREALAGGERAGGGWARRAHLAQPAEPADPGAGGPDPRSTRHAPRCMPEPGERRIEVNVPDYRLVVIEEGREILSMAVIVGRRDRMTPMLRVRMTAIQFNPPWGVPERNAREDLLPRFRRDPQAMVEKGFRVFGFVGGERVESTRGRWIGPRSTRSASPISSARMRGTRMRSAASSSSCRMATTSSCTTRPTGTCSAGPTAPSPPAASGWSGRTS
jgi:hypothetical protein